jgi:hypothetical protein
VTDRRRSRWLDLAARQRQWQIERQLPELKAGLEAERQAAAEHEQAQRRLAAAHEERRQTLARVAFAADVLSRHASHALRLETTEAQARQEADETAREAQALRAQAQAILSERDALRDRLERADERAAADERRRAAREHDELWLVRARPSLAATTTTAPRAGRTARNEEGGHED